MTVLVTGGAGFIGSHTVVELLGGGYDVVVVDNYSNSKPCVNDRVRKITGRDFKVYDCDMCNPAALDAVFAAEHIDAVIHFAGLKAVGESVAQPVRYYRNNLDSTLNLISSMKKTVWERWCSHRPQRCTAARNLSRSARTSRFPLQTPTVRQS